MLAAALGFSFQGVWFSSWNVVSKGTGHRGQSPQTGPRWSLLSRWRLFCPSPPHPCCLLPPWCWVVLNRDRKQPKGQHVQPPRSPQDIRAACCPHTWRQPPAARQLSWPQLRRVGGCRLVYEGLAWDSGPSCAWSCEGNRQGGQGSPNRANRLQLSDMFYFLSGRSKQKLVLYFFPLLYTNLKGSFP